MYKCVCSLIQQKQLLTAQPVRCCLRGSRLYDYDVRFYRQAECSPSFLILLPVVRPAATVGALLPPRKLFLEPQTFVAELLRRVFEEGVHHLLRLLLGVHLRVLEVPRAHARGVASDAHRRDALNVGWFGDTGSGILMHRSKGTVERHEHRLKGTNIEGKRFYLRGACSENKL